MYKLLAALMWILMVITVILSVGCLLMFKAFYVYYTLCPSYMMILRPAAFIINVRLHMSVLLSIHLSAYKYVYMLILTTRYCDGGIRVGNWKYPQYWNAII